MVPLNSVRTSILMQSGACICWFILLVSKSLLIWAAQHNKPNKVAYAASRLKLAWDFAQSNQSLCYVLEGYKGYKLLPCQQQRLMQGGGGGGWGMARLRLGWVLMWHVLAHMPHQNSGQPQPWLILSCHGLTLLHSERPKLHTILAFLSAIGLI